jgi:hypothetical protein
MSNPMQQITPAHMMQQRRGALAWSVATVIVCLFALAALRPDLGSAKQYQPAFAFDEEAQEAVNTSPFAQILGEVRATTADLMWVKTERYLHRGVAYAPHLDSDELARSGKVETRPQPAPEAHKATEPANDHDHADEHDHDHAHAHADEHDHDHDHAHTDEHDHAGEPAHEHEHEHEHGMTGLIPAAEQDYRGFVGVLQRQIEPWLPPGTPHKHEPGDELLPWYRMLTLANPHHWRGYMIGTWWLLSEAEHDPKALDEAQKFITEGIRNNPQILQLPLMQGRVRMRAQTWASAVASFRQSVQIGLKLRPADGKPNETTWTSSDEEDFRAAVRYIPVLLFKKINEPAQGARELAAARQLLPDDLPLQRFDPNAK